MIMVSKINLYSFNARYIFRNKCWIHGPNIGASSRTLSLCKTTTGITASSGFTFVDVKLNSFTICINDVKQRRNFHQTSIFPEKRFSGIGQKLGESKEKLKPKSIAEDQQIGGIPIPALIIGAGGIIPYSLTSLSILFCSWNLQHSFVHNSLHEQTAQPVVHINENLAQIILDYMQPIQIGYGACIISFLGAVHWGLELAEYGGSHSYQRYIFGVIAPLVAWSTIFLPTNLALVSQLFCFAAIYMADSIAVSRGWAPRWYGPYRYVLTIFVAVCIILTLVVKGWIGQEKSTSAIARLGEAHRAEEREHSLQAIRKQRDLASEERNKNLQDRLEATHQERPEE